ncbi:MAG TPA: YXWGXW repeat-containing protein [Candidatus Cybelea sp.]|jgi:hypothetical protein
MIKNVCLAFLFIGFATTPIPSPAQVSVGVGITIAPPPIPVYVQPPCPVPNYQWIPGYWGWGSGGYYWVPGTWVAAPAVGVLWTPGYWGWSTGVYYWHPGWWGPSVGFYGGVNYGFGYFGIGFVGGHWRGGSFFYNAAVVNVNKTVIRNTYVDKTVINKNIYNHSRVSYNGGPGGIQRRPTPDELAAERHRVAPTTEQNENARMAETDRNHLATVNHGYPKTMAMPHPYSATNRPRHFAPVTDADREAAHRLIAAPRGHRPPR